MMITRRNTRDSRIAEVGQSRSSVDTYEIEGRVAVFLRHVDFPKLSRLKR
jgi:hypothetical protein